MARANSGLSNHVKDTCRSRAERSTLIKAQLSALNVATEKGTSDKTVATRFSQCALDKRRRLEAEDATESDLFPFFSHSLFSNFASLRKTNNFRVTDI